MEWLFISGIGVVAGAKSPAQEKVSGTLDNVGTLYHHTPMTRLTKTITLPVLGDCQARLSISDRDMVQRVIPNGIFIATLLLPVAALILAITMLFGAKRRPKS